LVPHFSGNFLLTASLKYISLLTIANPVDYTIEFWEVFEATVSK